MLPISVTYGSDVIVS